MTIINVAVNGRSQNSISMTPYEMDFEKFAKSCSEVKQGGKYESYFIRGGDMSITDADDTHKNPECRIDHYHRNDSSLLSADLLILDADGSIDDDSSAPDGELIHSALKDIGVKHFIYSTHSHKMPGKGNRYRAVMPCKMLNKAQLKATVGRIINEIRDRGCPLGDVKEAKAWSQPWFFPTRDNPEDVLFEYYEYMEGVKYEPVEVNDKLSEAIADRKEKTKDRKNRGFSDKTTKNRTHAKIIENIIKGGEGLHHAINDFLYGQIKDGIPKSSAVLTVQGLMQANPNKDKRWEDRYGEIERSADGAIDKLKEEDNEDALNNSEDIKINLAILKEELPVPKYPDNCMADWPEPWPKIWENWKRFPAVVSEPLLVPTIIAFHGYLMNSKYLNARDRRPNLYQLSLAESTAYKDTNSTDVLRAMPKAMAEHGIFNSIFDDLADGDSNISSDTAFIKSLEANGGKKFWINTEATRVFQQLSSNHGHVNPNVLALADKMIEVVDGKTITGKVKANEAMKSVNDPNIQIVFYAQPETIEKYISEDMVDSGFLGRALITLDVGDEKEHSMFMELPDSFCTLDADLAGFYGNCNLNEKSLFERINVPLVGDNLIEVIDFEERVFRPLMPPNDGALRKMITRMGNSTEQLFSIVLGVCKEWDIWNGEEPRENVPINGLFPLLEFWAKCKHYTVNEYIVKSSDPIADAVIEGIMKFIDGDWIVDKRFNNFIKQGMVPRSLLVNRMRQMRTIKDTATAFTKLTALISQTIDYMIANQIIGQEEKRAGKARKKTKFVYVNK